MWLRFGRLPKQIKMLPKNLWWVLKAEKSTYITNRKEGRVCRGIVIRRIEGSKEIITIFMKTPITDWFTLGKRCLSLEVHTGVVGDVARSILAERLG